MTGDRGRVFGLDLMRAAAVLCVFFAHGLMLAIPTYPALLVTFDMFSVIGVELFFVLSGFLIGQLLVAVIDSRTTLAGFWVRRWFRTLPNYYLFLTINFFLYGHVFGIFPGSWRYIWFGQELGGPSDSRFFLESWDLAVEEWFYLLVPMLMLLVLRFTRRPDSVILWTCAFMIVALPIMRILYIDACHPAWDAGLRKITLLRLDAPMWGVLLAYAKARHENFFNRHTRRFLSVGLLLLIPALFYLRYVAPDISAGVVIASGSSGIMAALFFSVLTAGFACCLPVLDKLPAVRNAGLYRAITHVSLWSYSLYFVHLPLLYTVMFFCAEYIKTRPAAIALAVVVWLALALLAAAFNYRFFEKPITNLREHWLVSRASVRPQ